MKNGLSSVRYIVLSSTCTRARSDVKWNTAAIFWQEVPIPHFPVSIETKSVLASLCVTNYFPPNYPSITENVANLSILYCNFHGKFSDERHFLVPTDLTFTVMTRHATLILTNHPVTSKYHWCEAAFSREPLI